MYIFSPGNIPSGHSFYYNTCTTVDSKLCTAVLRFCHWLQKIKSERRQPLSTGSTLSIPDMSPGCRSVPRLLRLSPAPKATENAAWISSGRDHAPHRKQTRQRYLRHKHLSETLHSLFSADQKRCSALFSFLINCMTRKREWRVSVATGTMLTGTEDKINPLLTLKDGSQAAKVNSCDVFGICT